VFVWDSCFWNCQRRLFDCCTPTSITTVSTVAYYSAILNFNKWRLTCIYRPYANGRSILVGRVRVVRHWLTHLCLGSPLNYVCSYNYTTYTLLITVLYIRYLKLYYTIYTCTLFSGIARYAGTRANYCTMILRRSSSATFVRRYYDYALSISICVYLRTVITLV